MAPGVMCDALDHADSSHPWGLFPPTDLPNDAHLSVSSPVYGATSLSPPRRAGKTCPHLAAAPRPRSYGEE